MGSRLAIQSRQGGLLLLSLLRTADRESCHILGQSHGTSTHDLRGVYAGANNFDAYFRVILDDLLVGE